MMPVSRLVPDGSWYSLPGRPDGDRKVCPAGFGDLAGARWTIHKLTRGRSQPAIIGLDRAMVPAHTGVAGLNHPADDDGTAGNKLSYKRRT